VEAWPEDDDLGFGMPASLDELIADLPDHLAELIVLLDEDGVVLWFNRPAEAILGWARVDWIGQSILRVLHPDDVGFAGELLVSARATGAGTKEPVSYRMATAHSDWLTIAAMASTVELVTGRTVLVMSGRVTGRTRQQEFIAGEVDERLSVVFDHAVVAMAQVGLDGRILRVNPVFAERLGMSSADLHGVSFVGLVAPPERALVAMSLTGCVMGAGPMEVGASLGSASLPVRLHLVLVPDWVGDPLYVFAQVTDRPES
jgi:PAS domain S-box-containing protein